MENLQLEAQPRSILGKKVRSLRHAGITPIHIYGWGTESVAAQADAMTLRRVVTQAGHNTPITVVIDNQQHFTFVREVQRHPVSGQFLHVDFQQVNVSEKLEGTVPIHFEGEAPAVKAYHGELIPNLHEITVEALPTDMPHQFVVDVTGLVELGDGIHVQDLVPPTGVTILTDPEEVVIRVYAPTVAPTEEEEVAEAAEVERIGEAEKEEEE